MRNLDAEGRPQASARRHLDEILRTKRPECREKKGRRDQHARKIRKKRPESKEQKDKEARPKCKDTRG